MNLHQFAAKARRNTSQWSLRAYVGMSTLATYYLALIGSTTLNYRALEASGPAGFWVALAMAGLSLVIVFDVVLNDLLPERYHLRAALKRRPWLLMMVGASQLGMGLVIVRYDDGVPHLLTRLLVDACFAVIAAYQDVLRRSPA